VIILVVKLCLIGLGFIGSTVIEHLGKFNDKFRLQAIYDIDKQRMEEIKQKFPEARIMKDINDFADCDVVIEAASQQVVEQIFDNIIQTEKIFIPMSIGAFLSYEALYEKYNRLKDKKKLIKLPSGAIGGFDCIEALDFAGIEEAKLITSKPLKVFENHKYVRENQIKLSEEKRIRIFKGNTEDASRIFPRSINVGARLALSTLGPLNTLVEVYADPSINQNIHEIEITSKAGEYRFIFQNNPSPTNPRTSWLAALSLLQTLERLE
jgi:aspartate dehydrogenase